jgi:cell division protein FtsQ
MGVTVVVLGVAIVLLWTPVVGVRSVSVTGTHRVGAGAVRRAANVQRGHHMLTLPVEKIASRVSALPAVASAHVSRRWPSSVRIHVTERTPIAWRAESDGAHLFDRSGADFAVVPEPPHGLPRLAVPAKPANAARAGAALHALDALPARLSKRVAAVTAESPVDVRFTLEKGKKIVWGAAQDAPHKAAVLRVLMSRPGTTYDVAAPDLPTVS